MISFLGMAGFGGFGVFRELIGGSLLEGTGLAKSFSPIFLSSRSTREREFPLLGGIGAVGFLLCIIW